jgi:Arc/MetJ-type ribon-helix-helix transcriptional regulator
MRVTVTIDEAIVRLARADVDAGRAESISAWVADAMRAKAQARAELIADLEELNRSDPPSRQVLAEIARSLGRSEAWVAGALGLERPRTRRAR